MKSVQRKFSFSFRNETDRSHWAPLLIVVAPPCADVNSVLSSLDEQSIESISLSETPGFYTTVSLQTYLSSPLDSEQRLLGELFHPDPNRRISIESFQQRLLAVTPDTVVRDVLVSTVTRLLSPASAGNISLTKDEDKQSHYVMKSQVVQMMIGATATTIPSPTNPTSSRLSSAFPSFYRPSSHSKQLQQRQQLTMQSCYTQLDKQLKKALKHSSQVIVYTLPSSLLLEDLSSSLCLPLEYSVKYQRRVRFLRWSHEVAMIPLQGLMMRNVLGYLETGRWCDSRTLVRSYQEIDRLVHESRLPSSHSSHYAASGSNNSGNSSSLQEMFHEQHRMSHELLVSKLPGFALDASSGLIYRYSVSPAATATVAGHSTAVSKNRQLSVVEKADCSQQLLGVSSSSSGHGMNVATRARRQTIATSTLSSKTTNTAAAASRSARSQSFLDDVDDAADLDDDATAGAADNDSKQLTMQPKDDNKLKKLIGSHPAMMMPESYHWSAWFTDRQLVGRIPTMQDQPSEHAPAKKQSDPVDQQRKNSRAANEKAVDQLQPLTAAFAGDTENGEEVKDAAHDDEHAKVTDHYVVEQAATAAHGCIPATTSMMSTQQQQYVQQQSHSQQPRGIVPKISFPDAVLMIMNKKKTKTAKADDDDQPAAEEQVAQACLDQVKVDDEGESKEEEESKLEEGENQEEGIISPILLLSSVTLSSSSASSSSLLSSSSAVVTTSDIVVTTTDYSPHQPAIVSEAANNTLNSLDVDLNTATMINNPLLMNVAASSPALLAATTHPTDPHTAAAAASATTIIASRVPPTASPAMTVSSTSHHRIYHYFTSSTVERSGNNDIDHIPPSTSAPSPFSSYYATTNLADSAATATAVAAPTVALTTAALHSAQQQPARNDQEEQNQAAAVGSRGQGHARRRSSIKNNRVSHGFSKVFSCWSCYHADEQVVHHLGASSLHAQQQEQPSEISGDH